MFLVGGRNVSDEDDSWSPLMLTNPMIKEQTGKKVGCWREKRRKKRF